MQRLCFLCIYAAICVALAVGALNNKNDKDRRVKNDFETTGVLLLDAITFPKVVPHPTVNIVVFIANKRSVGDYNSDSMRADYLDFASKGELHGNATEVLFTQVIVNGAQNRKLADRIGVKPGDEFKFPELFLYKANSNEPIPYPRRSSWNIAQFTRWLSKHTNFYYGIEGTIEKYDLLAERFMFADKSEHEKIIKEAEAMASTLEPHERDNAEIYVKTMSKIAEKGYDFIFTEIDRLSKLLTTDISKSKKSDFVKRINIAYQFDRLDSPTGEENPEL